MLLGRLAQTAQGTQLSNAHTHFHKKERDRENKSWMAYIIIF